MKRRAVSARVATAIACFATTANCGGDAPPPRAPDTYREPESPPPKPALSTRSELGTVDPDAVKQVFHLLNDRFSKCQESRLEHIEVLSGPVKFFVRIGEDGAARWAYLEESELGDRDTEKCLVAAALEARWPRPQGGEAEVRYSMDLPLQASRPPNDWNSDKVVRALVSHGHAIAECKAGASVPFRATMYVGPGGHVLAAGVAMSSRDDESKADCLAELLTKMKGLPSPGSWPAKVSFGL
jgi:hypothetical protein